MTIATKMIENLKNNNGKFLSFSTVWDVHNTVVGGNRNSNVRKTVDSFFDKNKKIGKIWTGIGAKGRSQHSSTEVVIFDITGMSEKDMNSAGINYIGSEFIR